MNTNARVITAAGSHWYTREGKPCYEVPRKSGKGTKKTTLAEARELDLLPSVTTILKVLNKPQLNEWITEQAVLAVLSTPRLKDEPLDAFVHRVLNVERVQDQERDVAADKGTAIHDAIECCLNNKPFDIAWKPYVEAVLPVLQTLGRVVWTEKVMVGDGYAGRADCGLESDLHIVILDFKSARKLPRESYLEHKLQNAAYAKAHGNSADKHIITGNLYISTVIPGLVELCLQDQWEETYERGFKPLLQYWQFANNYRP